MLHLVSTSPLARNGARLLSENNLLPTRKISSYVDKTVKTVDSMELFDDQLEGEGHTKGRIISLRGSLDRTLEPRPGARPFYEFYIELERYVKLVTSSLFMIEKLSLTL